MSQSDTTHQQHLKELDIQDPSLETETLDEFLDIETRTDKDSKRRESEEECPLIRLTEPPQQAQSDQDLHRSERRRMPTEKNAEEEKKRRKIHNCLSKLEGGGLQFKI